MHTYTHRQAHMHAELCFNLIYRAQLQGVGEGGRWEEEEDLEGGYRHAELKRKSVCLRVCVCEVAG